MTLDVTEDSLMNMSDEEFENASQPTANEEEVIEEEQPKEEAIVDEYVFDDSKYLEMEKEDLIKELSRSEKQVFHKEKFINKQKEEVGLNRKKVASMAQEKDSLEKQLADIQAKKDSAVDDAEFKQAIRDEVIVEDRLAKVTNEQQSLVTESEILGLYPEANELIGNEIEQVVRAELNGKPESEIEATVNYFKSGAWKNANGQEIGSVLYAFEKARTQRTINEKDRIIAEYKSRNTQSIDKIANNIQKVASQSPIVRKGGNNTRAIDYTSEDFMAMSDKQFAELGKSLKSA